VSERRKVARCCGWTGKGKHRCPPRPVRTFGLGYGDARPQEAKLVECLRAICRYQPKEVAKDAFAYDRMVRAFQRAARAGLKEAGYAD
jgi:hypothetical protein